MALLEEGFSAILQEYLAVRDDSGTFDEIKASTHGGRFEKEGGRREEGGGRREEGGGRREEGGGRR